MARGEHVLPQPPEADQADSATLTSPEVAAFDSKAGDEEVGVVYSLEKRSLIVPDLVARKWGARTRWMCIGSAAKLGSYHCSDTMTHDDRAREAHIVRLVTMLPRAPESVIPRGVTKREINRFVQRTGVPLPDPVARWFELFDGPPVGPGGVFRIGDQPVGGQVEKIDVVYRRFPEWQASKWIPLATDGCGNYFVAMPCSGRWPVVFIEPILDPVVPQYVVASSPLAFFEFLFERETRDTGWPFARKYVLSRDRDILAFDGLLLLPWSLEKS